MIFADRQEAGQKLAARLLSHPLIKQTPQEDLLVLSIPRGGVVIGAMVAQRLGCAHNVIIAKKIGFPRQPEAAIGAMVEDGPATLDPSLPDWFLRQEGYLKQQAERTKDQIRAYIDRFRGGKPLEVAAKTVIVVDDGIATGETMRAAVLWLTTRSPQQRPQAVIVATPVCAPSAAKEFEALANGLICLSVPKSFWAVGQFYRDFRQVSDDEVIRLLHPTMEKDLT